jgi:hypothetical protein
MPKASLLRIGKGFIACSLLLILFEGCASLKESLNPEIPKPNPIAYPVLTHRYKNDAFDLTVSWMKNNFMSSKGELDANKENGTIQVTDEVGLTKPTTLDISKIVHYGAGYDDIKVTIDAKIEDSKTVFTFQFDSEPYYTTYRTYDWFCHYYAARYFEYIQPPKGNQRIESEQDKKEAAFEAAKGAIKSTDSNFTVYIPTKTNKAELENNKALISEMENQVKNRPVAISFNCDRSHFDRFASWMAYTYELLPNPTISDAYYRDSTQDNDFVIAINIMPPGLNIYVMTYEYFLASHK